MSQLVKWIICFVVFALLGWVGLYHGLPGSINSITSRLDKIADDALAKSGQSGWAQVTMDGQRAIVVGEAPSVEARNKAIISLRRATGAEGPVFGGVTVALADDIKIANPIPIENPYRFLIDYQGGYIRLSEAIPDSIVQIDLNSYVSQIFPESEFFDNTRIARGAPNDQWVEAIKSSLLSLSSLDEGRINIEDLEIKISGVTTSEEKAELAIARAQLIPSPYTVSGEINLNGKPILVMIKTDGATTETADLDNRLTEGANKEIDDLENLSFEQNQGDPRIDQTEIALPPQINEEAGNNNTEEFDNTITDTAAQDTTDKPDGVINVPAPSKAIKKTATPKNSNIETLKGLPPAPEPLVDDTVGELKEDLSNSARATDGDSSRFGNNLSFEEEKNIPELIGGENTTRSTIEDTTKASRETLPSIPTKDINNQTAIVSSAGIAIIGSQLYSKPGKSRETATQRYARDCENSLALISNHQPIKFENGGDRILSTSRPTLAALANTLLSCEQYKFIIEADTAENASSDSNLLLSQKRAKMVRFYLVSRGVKPAILKEIGYGASRPIADNSTQAGRSNNDRINITIDLTRN